MKPFLILILAATLAGCGSKPIAGGVAAGKPLGRIEGHAQAALYSVEQAKPVSAPIALPSLNSASTNLRAIVNVDVPDATREAELSEARVSTLQIDLKVARNELDTSFWSRRQKHLAVWIIGIVIASWALLGTAGVLLGYFGMAKWSVRIMRILPLSNVFAFIRDRLTGTTMLPVKERRSVFIKPQPPE